MALEIASEDFILTLKSHFKSHFGVPAALQRLTWSTRQLSDEKAVADYNIPKESRLQLLFSLPGSLTNRTKYVRQSTNNSGARSGLQPNASSDIDSQPTKEEQRSLKPGPFGDHELPKRADSHNTPTFIH